MNSVGLPPRTSAFAREGLVARILPFACGALAALVLAPFASTAPSVAQLGAAWAVTALVLVAALTVPWTRLPQWTELLPPVVYLLVIPIFGGVFGGANVRLDALILIPIVWVALYGRRWQLAVVLSLSLIVSIGLAANDSSREFSSQIATGTVLWLIVGGVAGVVVQRLVEQSARHAAEALLVIHTARDAFVATDEEGTITEWSPQAEQMFGWPREEVLGRKLVETVLSPQSRDAYRNELRELSRVGLSVEEDRRLECEAVNRTDTQFPVEITISSSPWNGQLQFNAFIRDISRRKQLEQEREGLLEREQLIRQELERQNVRLSELDDLRNEFVSMTSHELRTPLHAILGYCELLIGRGELESGQMANLHVIHRNASRLLRLADDLLVVAQAATGAELKLTLGPTRLDQVVVNAIEASQPAADERGIGFDLEIASVLLAEADGARLAQVVDNLVSNALKFSPENGRVRVSLTTSDGSAVIAVADSGSGLDDDAMSQMFDRFYRAPDAVARGVPGTGIGLTVVKRIVDAHNGTVAVTSSPGTGTTISVRVPVASAHGAHRHAPYGSGGR